MLARLALALLIACLAGPALASTHCAVAAPPVSTMAAHHGTPIQHHAPAALIVHDCIGCIPPTHGSPEPFAAGRTTLPMIAIRPAVAPLVSEALHPELPPPRLPA